MRAPAALALIAFLLPGCGRVEAPSTAADPIIARAEDEEEREGLTLARDDVDAEMRKRAADMDGEIERLRQENEALRRKLER